MQEQKKTEELRQNWRITEMQQNWKNRRILARKKAEKSIADVHEAAEGRIRALKEKYEASCKAIKAEAEAAIAAIDEELNNDLMTVARDQDDYLHQFRNYVAALPADERMAYDTRE